MDERGMALDSDGTDDMESSQDSKRGVYHVVPDADHGWQVKREGASASSPGHPGKVEAVTEAEDLARITENGRVVVHGQNGEVEAEYAPFAAELLRRTG